MEIYLDKRAVRQIRLSSQDAIEEGDIETLREDILEAFTEDQVEEIEESAVYPTPDILQRLGHAFDVNVLVVTDEPLPRLEFVDRGAGHRAA